MRPNWGFSNIGISDTGVSNEVATPVPVHSTEVPIGLRKSISVCIYVVSTKEIKHLIIGDASFLWGSKTPPE